MWKAIVHRKLKVASEVSKVLDHHLRTAEDILTAMVFGRLDYLPRRLAWELVVGASSGTGPTFPGDFEQSLWPRFRAPSTVEQTWVEPDVLWSSPVATVVVEVKWHDSQKPAQLVREHRTVGHHAGEEHTWVLALGSMSSAVRTELGQCEVPNLLTQSWREFRAAVQNMADRERTAPEHRRTLMDILAILATRGLRRTEYLQDLSLHLNQDALNQMRAWRTR